MEGSSSIREDVECKLRCINFRRVSNPRRVILLAFRVTESPNHKPESADHKPGSNSERGWQTWELRR
jgi:hypothetical protein